MLLTQEQAHEVQNFKMSSALTSHEDHWAQVLVGGDVGLVILVQGDKVEVTQVGFTMPGVPYANMTPNMMEHLKGIYGKR